MRNLALLVLLAIGLSFAALPRIERYFITQTGAREEATLRLATASLRSALSRTEALPALLAERPILAQILRDPENQGLLPFANEQLRQTALSLDLADIFVMDLDGTTIAASNYRRERSFVGRNFAFRPYFNDALSQGRGRFHGLGITSGQRGYFFSAPIIDNTEVLGVVVVKILLDTFEQTWRDGDNTILVTDPSNVIFLSDRADWIFNTVGPVPELAIEAISATRQYPLDRLRPLNATRESLGPTMEILRVEGDDGTEEFVTNIGLIAAAGWRVWVLTPTISAILQARQMLALMILAALFAGLAGALYLQRRARLFERLTQQRIYQEMLEARVAERTADLHDANTQLTQEVEDRRATEARLRRTQSELVQAGKLAALGQMSAGLSHEFNQPLAAVKAYAENAVTYLDRDRPDEARRNVGLISQMADRMAAISKHLRNFARRPQEKIGPIPLLSVLDDALALMGGRISAAGAEIIFARPEAEIMVMGGQVRLQQVLVNLLSNALDAMEGREHPRIEIDIVADSPRWQIRVRDHGSGLSRSAQEQLFDPFFTTKSPGKGLGLGLSISYNIVRDFGGTLAAHNHSGGGAVFVVDLAGVAASDEVAAE
jgi:two-component system, NtrC family, C4-dicarboxylate transport sensor histidine kinase DctB